MSRLVRLPDGQTVDAELVRAIVTDGTATYVDYGTPMAGAAATVAIAGASCDDCRVLIEVVPR